MDDAWRLSPRMIALFARGRQEAGLDDSERQIVAAWTGQMFARQKTLSGRVLEQFLPRRSGPVVETAEEAMSKWDNWGEGVNKFFAAQAPKADQ